MNRNNCGCAPYKPNTNRIDYIKEIYDTCDCVLPCESCECVKQTGTCPPTPAFKPMQQMKCCVENPKKGFWQTLFGGKKCSPSLNKKRDEGRKQMSKLKCVPLPNLNNDLCKNNVQSQHAANHFNSKSCSPKGCFPTPQSICGCHFYFNLENRTRKHSMIVATNDKQVSKNKETPFEYSYDINEEPERDNLASSKEHNANGNKRINTIQNILSSPHDRKNEGHKYIYKKYLTQNKRHSGNDGRKMSSVAFHPTESQTRRSTGISYNGQRKSSLCNRKRRSSFSSLPTQTEEPNKNDVHIGLTFTKEETKYFMPNNDMCLSLHSEQKSSDDCKSSQIDDSKESSDQVLTVEVHTNGVKVAQLEDLEEGDNRNVLSDHSKVKRYPLSESLSRELIPLMKRKGPVGSSRAIRGSVSEDVSEENIENTQKQHNKNRHSLISNGYSKETLDRRVSEILQKLIEIENKINMIENKSKDSKKIRVDFDGAKSTVSLHIKHPSTKLCDNGYNYINNSKGGSGNTVIEIRHTQSKSSTPVRKSFKENELRSSQSLDGCDKIQPSSHKIVIKLPKVSTKTQCIVLPDKQNKKGNEKCKQTILWNDVSNELKCSPLEISKTCYCYECVQKRLRCL